MNQGVDAKGDSAAVTVPIVRVPATDPVCVTDVTVLKSRFEMAGVPALPPANVSEIVAPTSFVPLTVNVMPVSVPPEVI